MAQMRTRVGHLFLSLIIGLAACATPPAQASGQDNPPVEVYFSDPNAPGAEFTLGGPDEDLQAAIEEARISIDVAVYDLNLYNIRDALVASLERGVQVRMVVENENFTEDELLLFTKAGIAVVVDGRSDSMHNKFLVIDRYEVWTGSMNYTLSDAYGNRNNLLRLRSIDLAENYETEFEEMFSQKLFGAHSPAGTLHRQVKIGDAYVETYFAPEDEVLSRLVELINGARESVFFLAYSITLDELAEALLAAQARGVEIRGVMDKAQAANAGGEFGRLCDNGVDVRLDGEDGRLHHKVLIVDGEVVVTGSYNFSANAEERNDENLLVIHDAGLASKYLAEFWRIWDLTQP